MAASAQALIILESPSAQPGHLSSLGCPLIYCPPSLITLSAYKAVEHLVQNLKPLLTAPYSLGNRQENPKPKLLDLVASSEVEDLQDALLP
jgi:hypothetical protein